MLTEAIAKSTLGLAVFFSLLSPAALACEGPEIKPQDRTRSADHSGMVKCGDGHGSLVLRAMKRCPNSPLEGTFTFSGKMYQVQDVFHNSGWYYFSVGKEHFVCR